MFLKETKLNMCMLCSFIGQVLCHDVIIKNKNKTMNDYEHILTQMKWSKIYNN